MFARMRNRIANFRPELDHRLVHFGFDLLFQGDFAALENLLDVRPQLASLRIDNREFLLDSEGVACDSSSLTERNIRRFRRFTQIILT